MIIVGLGQDMSMATVGYQRRSLFAKIVDSSFVPARHKEKMTRPTMSHHFQEVFVP